MSIAALSSQSFLYARANALARNKTASLTVVTPISSTVDKKLDVIKQPFQQPNQPVINDGQGKATKRIDQQQNVFPIYQQYQEVKSDKLELERHHPKAQIAISNYKSNENFNKLQEIQQMLGVNLYA